MKKALLLCIGLIMTSPLQAQNKFPSQEIIKNLPKDGGDQYNRLVFEKSPYLLQHCENPVDWYPWGPEAFEKAKKENKPIFLSVGYSSCHWCHVMEKDSFETKEVAKVLNKHYVSIKVDREERPDIDSVYMTATQIIKRGRGGWPNSVWLNAKKQPWYAETFVPKKRFISMLESLSAAYKTQASDIQKQADMISKIIRESANTSVKSVITTLGPKIALEKTLSKQFDFFSSDQNPGPKFPPH
ncbi:thioredoxin domain-containing protein, partial [bacterium]|nr:thioredoxin domain-containing protein [bacterium]